MSNKAIKRGMAIIMAGLLALPAGAALATPAPPGAGAATAAQLADGGNIVQVRARSHHRRHWRNHHRRGHWRGHNRHWRHHGHHRRGYYGGGDFGAGLAIGLIGSLVAGGLSEGSAYDAIDRCDARYRSFERSTGLYTTYSGRKRLCPYLR